MDSSMQPNQNFLNLKLHLANPKATIAEDITAPTVATEEMKSEFLKNVPKECPANPFHPVTKFEKLNCLGSKVAAEVNISEFVLNAPISIQMTGYTMVQANRMTNKWYSTVRDVRLNFTFFMAYFSAS
jgi:hypothetical protein